MKSTVAAVILKYITLLDNYIKNIYILLIINKFQIMSNYLKSLDISSAQNKIVMYNESDPYVFVGEKKTFLKTLMCDKDYDCVLYKFKVWLKLIYC